MHVTGAERRSTVQDTVEKSYRLHSTALVVCLGHFVTSSAGLHMGLMV